MNRRALVAMAVVAACACGGSPPRRPVVAAGAGLSSHMVFTGACDASGAVWLRGGAIAVADDEDNALRIYDLAAPGPPIETIDTRSAMADARGKHPEMDLEAAARIGDRVYWLASHGRKKSGKPAPGRLRLFATDLAGDGTLATAGTTYEHLVEDLSALPGVDLAAAAAHSPSDEGGLNIEGLDETAGGELLLGFRSPLIRGRAIIVPIRNPAAMIERGERARLAAPIELDLGGRGVRAMEWDGHEHWIVAGGTGARTLAPRLYRWDGRGRAQLVDGVRFGDLNPEALAWVGDRMLVLSDDGERRMGPAACKKLVDAAARRFRAAWLR